MSCLSQLDIVILAGGLGTRLRTLFPDRPKVMVPIKGRPFLDHALDHLQRFGARRVILALGHMASAVEEHIRARPDGELEIVTSVEATPLGTGGGLRATLPLIKSETALVMNGDSFTKVELCQFVEFHRSRSASLSMLLTYVPNVGRFGVVETDGEGRVRRFLEKPSRASPDGYINAGVYLIEKAVIQEIPPDVGVSLERDVFPRMCNRGFYALKGNFPFIDIGTPESFRLADSYFSEVAHDN